MRLKISRSHALLALGVFVFYMAFALYTQHAWEDWYITFKASKNLATGQGLAFMPNQHVHTFTSVLGTLIPAVLSFVTFNVSDDLVLWLFRILNAGIMAWCAVLLARCSARWFFGILPAVLLVAGAMLESKVVDFAINGMEAPYTMLGVTLFFYFVTFYPVEKLGVRLGIAWALLEYARPDGFLFAIVLSIGLLAFLPNRRATFRTLAVSAGVGLLVFLPWLVFATWYYGNPVPHSLIAKSGLVPRGIMPKIGSTLSYLASFVTMERSLLDRLFLPANFYAVFPKRNALDAASRLLATVASLVWLLPGVKPLGRIASLATLGFSIYLVALAYFVASWYTPGLVLLAIVSLAFGLDALLQRLADKPRLASRIGQALVGVTLAFVLGLTVVAAHEFRNSQRVIETGHRKQIGLWLKHHAKSPQETVMMECLGYIGYFSGLKTYDYPGMSSPEMVDAQRTMNATTFAPLIRYLRPDWVVLRPQELAVAFDEDSIFLREHYEIRAIFNADAEIGKIRFLPFPDFFGYDAIFYVIGKKASGAPVAPALP
jgi:hypothetical protein